MQTEGQSRTSLRREPTRTISCCRGTNEVARSRTPTVRSRGVLRGAECVHPAYVAVSIYRIKKKSNAYLEVLEQEERWILLKHILHQSWSVAESVQSPLPSNGETCDTTPTIPRREPQHTVTPQPYTVHVFKHSVVARRDQNYIIATATQKLQHQSKLPTKFHRVEREVEGKGFRKQHTDTRPHLVSAANT